MHLSLPRAAALFAIALTGNLAHAALPNTIVANYGTVALDYTQGFSHAYATTSPNPTELINVASIPTAFNFYDDFLFTLPASGGTFSAAAVTIDLGALLGINNLQARIYNTAGGLTTGIPAQGTLAVAWSAPFSAAGLTGTALAFASPVALQPNTQYALEVRGLVTGLAGGSYGGNMNITAQAVSAVPEPQSYAFLAAGLLTLGLLMRRRMAR